MERVLAVPFRLSAKEGAERLARGHDPPGLLRVLRRGARADSAPVSAAYLPLVAYRLEVSARYAAAIGTYKYRLRTRPAAGRGALPHFERYVAWERVRGDIPPTRYAPESPLCQAYAGTEYNAAQHEWVLKGGDYLRVACASRDARLGDAFAVPADVLLRRVLHSVSADLAAKARAALFTGRQWRRPEVVGLVDIEALRVLRVQRYFLYVPAYVQRRMRYIVSICNAHDGAVSAVPLFSPLRVAVAAATLGAAFQVPGAGVWTGGVLAALAAAWARYWPIGVARAREWQRQMQEEWWRFRREAGEGQARAEHDDAHGREQQRQQRRDEDAWRQQAPRTDYYAVLGVRRDAPVDEIKRAFRRCALRYHPDRFKGESEAERAQAERKFREALRAYQTLRDAKRRKQYDEAAGN